MSWPLKTEGKNGDRPVELMPILGSVENMVLAVR